MTQGQEENPGTPPPEKSKGTGLPLKRRKAGSRRNVSFKFTNILPPDALGPQMRTSEEEEQRYQKADHHKLDILARTQQLSAKKKMGERVFWLVTVWLFVVMVTIWMQGSGCFIPRSGESFGLSDTVLIALITTTTGNIALFLTIVIKHLFPKEPK